MGLSTTCCSEVSHRPRTAATSNFPAATRPSISGLRPIVPISTTSATPLGTELATVGATPVTRWRSVLRSFTTRTTPAWSPLLTTSGAARPAAARVKPPDTGLNDTYSPVLAAAATGSAKDTASTAVGAATITAANETNQALLGRLDRGRRETPKGMRTGFHVLVIVISVWSSATENISGLAVGADTNSTLTMPYNAT